MAMGTGKTATAINILNRLYKSHCRILRTLIACPPIVIQNWKKEIRKFSSVKIMDQQIIPLVGTGTVRSKTMEKVLKEPDKIVIINYETLLMFDPFELIKKWKPEVIIYDESHKLKDHKTRRSVKARELSDQADYRYILTGTPVLNTPMDIFHQYRVMDLGEAFGKNFFSFRNTYFYDKNAGMPAHRHFPDWKIKPGAMEEMKGKIEKSSLSVRKEECLDLPPLIKKVVKVPLGKDQARAYEQMKRDFIAFVNDQACVADLAITKGLRMQQIISGHLPVGENERKIIHFKPNPRLDAAKEILEEICGHSKILVWCVFKEDFKAIAQICDELEIQYVEVHGSVSAPQKQKNVDAFNSDEKIRVFISHPGSGGIGLTLTTASYTLFYSRNFSLENDLQAESRNHRGGSEIHSKITRIDLVAENTLDEIISERLKGKEAMGRSMLTQIAHELSQASEMKGI